VHRRRRPLFGGAERQGHRHRHGNGSQGRVQQPRGALAPRGVPG
jgi:hypothetical protein